MCTGSLIKLVLNLHITYQVSLFISEIITREVLFDNNQKSSPNEINLKEIQSKQSFEIFFTNLENKQFCF